MSVNYEYVIQTFEIRPPRGAPQVRDFASGAGCNRVVQSLLSFLRGKAAEMRRG
jgi:hypothetical protein